MDTKRGRSMMASKWTAKRLKGLRKRHRLSQADFCDVVPISIDALQHYEQERGPIPPLVCWALDRIEKELVSNGHANGKATA